MVHQPAEATGSDKGLQVISWVLFGLATIGIAAIAVCMLGIRPKFLKIFQEFGAELPSATAWLLTVPTWFVAALLMVWWAGLLAKECVPLPRSATILLNAISLLAAGGLFYGFIVLLYLPLTRLIEELS